MATFKPTASDYSKLDVEGESITILHHQAYDSFDASLLNLGNISNQSIPTDAMAAFFDLQGFTRFCNQIDPQHSLPLFLNKFLDWLFTQIKIEMTQKSYAEGVHLYSPLPFYTKFLGDGLLVLWDVRNRSSTVLRNIIVSCSEICGHYSEGFYKEISKIVAYSPRVLRCGLARGTVLSVGDGNDYVGPCINLAARLQKIPGATFAFSPRGINMSTESTIDFFKKETITLQANIRGIGEAELICIKRSEHEMMSENDKSLFVLPGN